jgi:hypothetical protein
VVMELEGNEECADCPAFSPEWASVTYGSLLCLQVSVTHVYHSQGAHANDDVSFRPIHESTLLVCWPPPCSWGAY